MSDPVGPENMRYLFKASDLGEPIICAWGNAIAKPLRIHVANALKVFGKEVHCFGYTADRQPRHPLMLPYATPLEIYAP